MTVASRLDITKTILDDSAVDLEGYIVAQCCKDLLDANHVWQTPELNKAAAEYRAELKREEHELLYGNGTSQPLGIIAYTGEVKEGRQNCPRCGRDLSATPSECRRCGIKASSK